MFVVIIAVIYFPVLGFGSKERELRMQYSCKRLYFHIW